jgi:hypothetical protein
LRDEALSGLSYQDLLQSLEMRQCHNLQASVLLRFKDRPTWSLDELASVMKLSTPALRKTVIFWTSQGRLWHQRPAAEPAERVVS